MLRKTAHIDSVDRGASVRAQSPASDLIVAKSIRCPKRQAGAAMPAVWQT